MSPDRSRRHSRGYDHQMPAAQPPQDSVSASAQADRARSSRPSSQSPCGRPDRRSKRLIDQTAQSRCQSIAMALSTRKRAGGNADGGAEQGCDDQRNDAVAGQKRRYPGSHTALSHRPAGARWRWLQAAEARARPDVEHFRTARVRACSMSRSSDEPVDTQARSSAPAPARFRPAGTPCRATPPPGWS